MSQRIDVLLQLLADAGPSGLTPADLLGQLRRTWPSLTPSQAQRLVDSAGDPVAVADGRVRLATGALEPAPGT